MEDDLDWLARNVHKWVPNELLRMKPCDNGNGKIRASWCYSGDGGFTKDQWLARRAELQNKPNWADAPEWAEWLAQDEDGAWWWYQDVPEKCDDGWLSELKCEPAEACGEVLGDWRDTLERRPDMHKSEPKIDTSAEHVQKTTQSMHDWHERGELPPVGVECEVMHRERWVVCDVIAHFQQKAAMVAAYTVDNGNALKQLDSCIAEYFRPIRTERDVLLSIIVEEMNRYDTDGKLADAILAAGFKRGEA